MIKTVQLLQDIEERRYMSRIKNAFNEKALMAYITCGDPDLETTTKIIREVIANGANIIGLGVPFSDPTAESFVIQESNIRALKNGITTDDIFAYVKELRKEIDVPIVFMTYANVVFSYGAEQFYKNSKDCSIDGILIADLPYEEREEFLPLSEKYDIELVTALSFNSGKRANLIAKNAKELIYVLSSSEEEMEEKAESLVADIRSVTDVPCIISYGVCDRQLMSKMSSISDGVVASEDIMNILKMHGTKAPEIIGEFIKEIKNNQ